MQSILKDRTNLYLTLVIVASLIGGLFFSYRSGIPISSEAITTHFASNLRQQLAELDNIAEEYQKQWKKSKSITLEQVGLVGFVIITNSEVEQWTGTQFIPNYRVVADDFELRHNKTGAGDYLFRKWKLDSNRFVVASIPLHIYYKIQNEYLLPWWNEELFAGYEVEIIDANSTQGNEVLVEGKSIFRVRLLRGQLTDFLAGVGAAILISVAAIAFFILLFRVLKTYRSKNPSVSYVILAGVIVVIRYLMIELRFPARFMDSQVFDPKHFASSDLNPSLGDMVLNSITVAMLCLLLFKNSSKLERLSGSLKSSFAKGLITSLSVTAILFGVLLPFVVIQTVYNNSGITLNISDSVNFNSLRILTFCSLIVSWISSFLFIHVSIRIVMSDSNRFRNAISLVLGSVIFIGINMLSGQLYTSSLWIGLGFIGLVILFRIHESLQSFHFLSFVYFFLGVMAFSLNSLLAVIHFSNTKSAHDQVRFANAFLIDRDDFGEFLLDEASQKISSDLFIQTRLSGPFTSKDAVRSKVRQIFIPGYFNKYNIEIHLFGGAGESLDEGVSLTYKEWIASYNLGATNTAYTGIYFLGRPDNESTRKYIVVIPIKRNEISAGVIVLELSLKRIIPDTIYPELLVDNRFQQAYRSQEFSYAVIINRKVQFRSGNFNYNVSGSLLDDPMLYTRGVKLNGYLHIGSGEQNGRVVIVSSPLPSIMYHLGDFSFFLILGLGAIMLYLLIIGILDFLRKERLMMAARIQLILNLSFFIPLIGVSIITLGLTAKSNQEQLNAEYLAKSRNFTNELSAMLSDPELRDGMSYEQNFAQLAKMSNLDANLFTPNGRLQFTSQPLIFESQLLAPYMSPTALQRFRHGDALFIDDEQVGSLGYYVAYSALHSPTDGSLLGIAAIPFFQSAYLMEKMQITVLSNILSIFTAIFIVLLVISYWVSKWLTFPLRMITSKLGRISLTQSNQPLEWHSDDEIGIMVKEYNQMLSTLSDSKSELERTQRERAWREIAQQVAHEIKNPLTPMKLTLQKLERLSENDPDKFEKIQKAIASILSQVDTLDGVASSFSTFAKMPEPVMESVELIGLLKGLITLHGQSHSIHFLSDTSQVVILGDTQLLNRIFSNIILNGIQSARPDAKVVIDIAVTIQESIVRVTIKDNGAGVEDSFRDKIFLPHFSTKQSGSGLGLAIARQGIEQMGGKIFFESKLGIGTSFYIDLPIHNA